MGFMSTIARIRAAATVTAAAETGTTTRRFSLGRRAGRAYNPSAATSAYATEICKHVCIFHAELKSA
eukprot:730424-Pleurochrysis_carterae.AAC.3